MKPSSLEEAVACIRAMFPESELRAWAAQSETEAQAQAHFNLGLWVRNNWVHGGGSPLAGSIRDAMWFIHDDDISTMVIRALWENLNGRSCSSIDTLLSLRFPGLSRNLAHRPSNHPLQRTRRKRPAAERKR